MKRWGSGDRFLTAIESIRAAEPDAAFRSSFIVGFPGETEARARRAARRSSTPPRSTGPGSSRSRPKTARPRRPCPAPSPRPSSANGCASAKHCRTRSPRAARDALVGAELEVLVDGTTTRPATLVGRTHREAPEIDGVVRLDADWARPGALVRAQGHRGARPRPRAEPIEDASRDRQPPSVPRPPARAAPRSATTAIATPANFVTLARLVLAVPTLILDHRHRHRRGSRSRLWFLLTTTDGLDGWLARRDGTTRSGAFLDPLADKFLVLGGFFALGIHGDFAWAAGHHRRPSARSASRSTAPSPAGAGISVPARRLGQVEGLLPVPRRRRRAASRSRTRGPRSTTRCCGSRSRSRWSRAVDIVLSGYRSSRQGKQARSRLVNRASPSGRTVRCDVLAIGTELLLGQIVDTNSAWIGEQLAAAGIDTFEHRKVGDNLPRMVAALRELLDRRRRGHRVRRARPHARRRHPRSHRRGDGRRARAARRARRAHRRPCSAAAAATCPENNLRQADVPKGGDVIPNPIGTAPGLRCEVVDARRHQGRLRGARRPLRDAADDHRPRAPRPARALRGAGRDRVAVAEDLGHVGVRARRDDRRPGRRSRPTPRSPSSPAGSRASTCA